MSTTPEKPSPQQGTTEPVPAHEHRARLWIGLSLAIVGATLVGDPVHRLQRAWELLGVWWPWALIVLAAVNAIASIFRLANMIGPAALAFVALVALGVRHGFGGPILDWVLPLVAAALGVALLARSQRQRIWTRVMATGSLKAPPVFPLPMRPRAILGELRVDLRDFRTHGRNEAPTIWVTVLFGHVHLIVPADWHVDPIRKGSLLVGLHEQGPNDGSRSAKVSIAGFAGILTVSRS